MPADTSVNAHGEPLTADYHLIKSKLPTWLIESRDAGREAFKRADSRYLDWLVTLKAEQRDQLKRYNDRSAASQAVVDQAMASVQDAESFARPLLAKALREQYSLDADPDKIFVHLRKPIELGEFGIRVGNFSVLTLSLLQAVLHNFEEAECQAGAFDVSSCLRQGPAPDDTPIDTPMTVQGFLSLCRHLDVGGKYQHYLNDFLYPADTTRTDALRAKVITAQKDALHAAAYLALLRQDIDAGDYAVVRAVIDDQRGITDDGKPVWFCDLSIMGLRVDGCTVLVSVEKYQYAKEVLVYIPHDPEHPLKKYPDSQALQDELTRQLMASADEHSGPSAYQRFFANYLSYADQPTYFSRLTQNAADGAGDPYAVLRIAQYIFPFVSAFVSLLVSPQRLPPKPQPSREPIKSPDFYIRVVSKRGLWEENVQLWQDNFDKLRSKLVADARLHAVSTAEVDARARAKKIAALEQGGLFALNLVSMFVPVLGEVMMGVMAGQLLYETFEGVIEWREGDRQAALEHVTDVAENLALLAVMAAGGSGVRKLLNAPPVIEGVKPVTLASGEQKLWKADLAPYKAPVSLRPGAAPDSLGLYAHNGRKVLRLESDQYWVSQQYPSGEYRIQHPNRPDAYAPLLEHNHEGVWHHEAEEPLTWEGDTLLRRLGMPADALDAGARQQALLASGLETDALRDAHIDHEPMPLVLAESLKRFRIRHDLARFVEQIKSPEPAQYAQADLALQMDILKRRGLLPETPPLRVYDNRGITLWDDPAPVSVAREGVVINDVRAARGDRLAALHERLEAGSLSEPDYAQQAKDLQAQLAIEEATLIQTLTRQELEAQPLP